MVSYKHKKEVRSFSVIFFFRKRKEGGKREREREGGSRIIRYMWAWQGRQQAPCGADCQGG